MAEKLSVRDCGLLRKNYATIAKEVDIKAIIIKLFENKVIGDEDTLRLCDEEASNDKCAEFLVHEVLLKKGTYTDLEQVLVALIQSKQDEACRYFPSFNQDENEDDEDNVAENGTNETEIPNRETEAGTNEGEDGIAMAAGAKNTVMKFGSKVKKITKEILKKPGSNDWADGHNVMRPKPTQYNTDHERFTDAFVRYEAKKINAPYGRGICVVFALFTGDLKGYEVDVTNLENFFHRDLGYDFKSFKNLTQKELFEKVKEVKDDIEKEGHYDRLFVVILSHGTKDGILTCATKCGRNSKELKPNAQQDEAELLTTDVNKIVEEFKHDELPSLKGMPKVFLVQACRGPAENMVEAAGPDSVKSELEDTLPYKPQCPVDGDIMICYATTMDHPSLVCPGKGSWFVQDVLAVFKKHHKEKHVADMMTVINLAISERRGSLELKKHQSIEALQMPCTWSSFRKMFYL